MGKPILSKTLFISTTVILRLYAYKDVSARQTGPEILKAIAFRMFVSKFNEVVERITLGTKSNKKNQYGNALLEKPL